MLGTVVLALGVLPLITGCSANEGAGDASEGTVTTANAPVSLSYVALGDSLAVGLGAYRGYVDRYADYIEADTGVQVEVVNMGQSGETSSQLLYALRNRSSLRQALSAADVITFNIGINDLGHAGEAYENGTCGGFDDQDCLRAAAETFEENWDAIIAELLSLCATGDTVIRTVGLGYTPHVDVAELSGIFEPYVDEVNRHIATTATNNGIPYAEVHLDKEGISRDGVHPNDEGYQIIAERLRELRYGPLG